MRYRTSLVFYPKVDASGQVLNNGPAVMPRYYSLDKQPRPIEVRIEKVLPLPGDHSVLI